MSGDHFDKDIAKLYQQRKSLVDVPTVTLIPQRKGVKYSPLKLLTLLVLGSTASFGIMAIISHLSTLPNDINIEYDSSYTTKYLELPTKAPEEEPDLPLKVLPPKPVHKSPATYMSTPDIVNKSNIVIAPAIIEIMPVPAVSIPKLTQPETLIEPTFKVLPKYSLSAIKANQAGEVKLSYRIDNNGKVNDITVVSSSVNRDLQRSTKKALSQWQYKPSEQLLGQHEVVFKFTLPKG